MYLENGGVSAAAWRTLALELDMRRHRREMAALTKRIRTAQKKRWKEHEEWRQRECTEAGRERTARWAYNETRIGHQAGPFIPLDFGL